MSLFGKEYNTGGPYNIGSRYTILLEHVDACYSEECHARQALMALERITQAHLHLRYVYAWL